MKILIKNGSIINSSKTEKLDILINGNKIIQISENISNRKEYKLINAEGKYVIPGGIDPHVHMHLPNPTGFSSDDFKSGSKAALYGGTTTIIDFVTPYRGQSMQDAIEVRKEEAKDTLTNYSFHVSPVEWKDSIEGEIKECIAAGFNSFKVYLAYKNVIGLEDADFYKVMKVVGKAGGMVTVHCEDGDKIEDLRQDFISKGKTTPEFHPKSRPPIFEANAVKKAIDMAKETNCPLYIVHVSSELSLKHIKEAQQRGQKVFAETCPHYLLLDESKYKGEFEKTSAFVLSPPIRKVADKDALWKDLKNGTIQTTGTDHCPFMLSQKEAGKDDFRKIPNGAGGVEHRLELLYTYGVLENKISLDRWVDICSTQSAKIFGLFPAKGIIAEGSDADIVIWNSKTEKTISVANHNQSCDSNIFEGFKIKGSAETVIRNGEVVIENSKINEGVRPGELLFRFQK